MHVNILKNSQIKKFLFSKLLLRRSISITRWLYFVLSQISNITSFYNRRMELSQAKICERTNSMKERIQKIEVDEQNVSNELQSRLQQETKSLSPKLYIYTHSREFEKKLCTWANCSFPQTMDTWEKTKTEVMKEIECRFKQLLIEWESENQLCSDVHRQLVNEFLRRQVWFVILNISM